jgi:hypothetical protein
MTAACRPIWLFRFTVACAAVVCALLVGASMSDWRPAPVASFQGMGAHRLLLASEGRARALNHDAPRDRASTRPVALTRAAWQRGGGRRSHRTTSSQFSSGIRMQGMVFNAAPRAPRGVRAAVRARAFRRDDQLGSAPTRAPPPHR